MKTELKFLLIGLPLIFISMVYFGCYIADNDYNAFSSVKMEADGTHYHNNQECQYEGLECPIINPDGNILAVKYVNGEILTPDYVHSDTLIVTNADYLNYCLNNYDIGSDGDINDILASGTKKY